MDHNQHNQQHIVYLLDSFPLLSQTFVLQEILELQREGLAVSVFSLFEPAAGETARGNWREQVQVCQISHRSRWRLLLLAARQLLKTPRRFLHTARLTLAHHDLRSTFSYLCDGVFVAKQLEQQEVAHLHAHFAVGATSVVQIVHLLTDIPYSFTTHAYDIYLSQPSVLAYKMSMAHFVVTCSKYNQRYLRTLVDNQTGERIYCIYVGLNLHLFPTTRLEVPVPDNRPLILAVCRLVEKKGMHYLIDACHILKKQGYGFLCRIVGDGPQRQQLAQQIHELELTDKVELVGAAAHEQVLQMYQQATVMALPCIIASDGDRDGIPNALMEALYMQIPVVSTPVSGIPELVADEWNGLLVPQQDSSALAHALARLLDDPALCQQLGRAGRETIKERFDIASNTRSLVQLFFDHQHSTTSTVSYAGTEAERLS